MNEILRDLLTLSPGIVSGLKGDGVAMQAFMEAYQRTKAQMDQRRMLQEQRGLALEDRQRGIARQEEADRFTREDRARQGVVQQQQDTLRSLQIPGTLAELGATGEMPQDARRIIESVMPQILAGFGQATMAYGEPAVQLAEQVITGRQKKQMAEFVDAALKTTYVADNPEADPVLTELPAHIVKMIGKPEAKLSELQRFAQLPVGKPQGKTRVPPAAGSMEEYSDPTTTPERKAQIEQDRKRYMQADDRPPITINTASDTAELAQQLVDGTIVPSMLSRRGNFNQLLAEANRRSKAQTGKPYNASRAQTEFAAAQRFVGAMNGPQQQRFRALAGAVVNTINEVRVLSQELQNSGVPVMNRAKLFVYAQAQGNSPNGQLAARYIGAVNTLKEEFANLAQGGYAPTEDAWKLANQQINGDFGVKQLDAALTEVQRLINYRMQAFEALTPYGVSPTNPVQQGGFASQPMTPKGPAIGSVVRDKKTGALVEVTGVRPDGALIVKPRPQ